MRKIYKKARITCLGLMLSVTFNINSQTVSDFENLNLTPNSYWNGSDYSGNHNAGTFTSFFNSGTAEFINVYDTTWGATYGYWSAGFAYSNMTDSTTSGASNLYSAKAASGVNGSSNYIVCANNSVIKLTGAALGTTVTGCYITNGTYAANSMRDGDSFGKQFGDSLDANGIPDGTNGNDWFKVTIWGYNSGILTSDSVEFYLADYRFANNAQDYIVKTWEWVDLTPLGNIDSVIFKLSSSDVGQFGMNTPAYFCIDNFNDQSVGVNEITSEAELLVYPNPVKENINVYINDGITFIEIIDVAGKTILSYDNIKFGLNTINVSNLKSGVYLLRTNNNVTRIIKE